MYIKVDTTSTQRGQSFDIIVEALSPPTIKLYYFNALINEYTTQAITQSKQGKFYINTATAPNFDGFILATINGHSVVVKKSGNPAPYFVIGYKNNYTIPYKQYDFSGNLIDSGDLTPIVDGFYYTKTQYNRVIQTLNNNFIIKDNSFKLDYNVTMPDTTISSETLPNVQIPSVNIADITLPDITLPDITLPSTTIGNAVITKG